MSLDDNLFKLYMRIAKSLALKLSNEPDRIVASKWIQKFENTKNHDDRSRRDHYIKLFLITLQRKRLVGPFKIIPEINSQLTIFDNEYQPNDISKIILEEEYKLYGNPKYKIETNGDLTEYSVYQEIPEFGAHFYYSYSPDPILKWFNFEKAFLPKDLLLMKTQSCYHTGFLPGFKNFSNITNKSTLPDETGSFYNLDKTKEKKMDKTVLTKDGTLQDDFINVIGSTSVNTNLLEKTIKFGIIKESDLTLEQLKSKIDEISLPPLKHICYDKTESSETINCNTSNRQNERNSLLLKDKQKNETQNSKYNHIVENNVFNNIETDDDNDEDDDDNNDDDDSSLQLLNDSYMDTDNIFSDLQTPVVSETPIKFYDLHSTPFQPTINNNIQISNDKIINYNAKNYSRIYPNILKEGSIITDSSSIINISTGKRQKLSPLNTKLLYERKTPLLDINNYIDSLINKNESPLCQTLQSTHNISRDHQQPHNDIRLDNLNTEEEVIKQIKKNSFELSEDDIDWEIVAARRIHAKKKKLIEQGLLPDPNAILLKTKPTKIVKKIQSKLRQPNKLSKEEKLQRIDEILQDAEKHFANIHQQHQIAKQNLNGKKTLTEIPKLRLPQREKIFEDLNKISWEEVAAKKVKSLEKKLISRGLIPDPLNVVRKARDLKKLKDAGPLPTTPSTKSKILPNSQIKKKSLKTKVVIEPAQLTQEEQQRLIDELLKAADINFANRIYQFKLEKERLKGTSKPAWKQRKNE